MGFTKIYKQTMLLFSNYQGSPAMGSITMGGNLSYKDWTGETHTGFVVCSPTGSSSPYYSYIGRPNLLTNMHLSNLTSNSYVLPTTQQANTANTYTYMAFGSGNSAESEDSYQIDSPYTYGTDFTVQHSGVVISYDPDTDKTYISKAIAITAVNDMTIREIGMYTCIWKSRTSNTSYQWTPPVLMYRKVLSTPISILAGQTVTIDFRISGG